MRNLNQEHHNFLSELVKSAEARIRSGYYSVPHSEFDHRSLKNAIESAKKVPVVAEIKFASPSAGKIRRAGNVGKISASLERGGAVGLSILTEPEHFNGRLEYLAVAKKATSIPVLMKDIVVDKVQIDAAHSAGADAVLLVMSIFTDGVYDKQVGNLIDHAHGLGLEVILESHTRREFELSGSTDADLLGINNRDLKTLVTNLDNSRSILGSFRATKPVICESGISRPGELKEFIELGADAFLIGTSVMSSADIEMTVRSFVEAGR